MSSPHPKLGGGESSPPCPPLDYARAVQIAAQLIQFRMVQRRLIAGNVHVDASSLFVYID